LFEVLFIVDENKSQSKESVRNWEKYNKIKKIEKQI
jgi:hypothetical protein